MPKIVDHELRRRELAQAAVRVIARNGLEGATTRAVATESGWTTGVLKHYFVDKDDILRHALRELEVVNVERFRAVEAEPTGYAALRAAVASTVEDDFDHAAVWIAFISRAATHPVVGEAMRRGSATWQRRWARLVRRGQQDGSIRPDIDADQVAIELWALVSGLRIAVLFNPGLAWRVHDVTLLDQLRAPDTAVT